jgi:hypothetical protein
MTTLSRLWHEVALRHGAAWVEMKGRKASRKQGVVIECPCGKRWLSRAPWDLA